MASLEKSCKYEKQVILQQIQNLKQLNSFGAGYIDYADIEQWRDRFVFFLFHRWSYMNNAAHLSFGKGCEKNIQSKNLIFGDDLPRKKNCYKYSKEPKKNQAWYISDNEQLHFPSSRAISKNVQSLHQKHGRFVSVWQTGDRRLNPVSMVYRTSFAFSSMWLWPTLMWLPYSSRLQLIALCVKS